MQNGSIFTGQPYELLTVNRTVMRKKIALLLIGTGFLTGSITFAALYSNNDVKKCQSCNSSSCVVKTVSVEPERPLVSL